ncbi:type II secretion system minor pseudopilin GspH [Ferrimonas sp. SCSIO 43195]|uniref:type II secretion system minor pseudopilin GspH n=1 Tax=Ferrimonas sp. SCSIO 43195 TaxID=2822844 RepID=UPI002075CFFF|nr:type II secretion system minor pseudopilin GspH [Ferrimonas sp. SCSIO 43195]USD37804.1 type II secretion system minor pseudopilin GspH [Ferrimonas sp. SCSIO 43195]
MRISPRHQSGFTLLEIMLVLVLIGVAAMSVTLTVGGDPRQEALDKAANEFASVVSMALEESVLSGQEVGVVVEEDHYFFARFNVDKDDWEPLQAERLYRERQMPEGVLLSLSIEGMPLAQSDEEDESEFGLDESLFEKSDEEKKNNPEPQLLILPSGEITPFSLQFEDDTVRPTLMIELEGNAIGDIVRLEEEQ